MQFLQETSSVQSPYLRSSTDSRVRSDSGGLSRSEFRLPTSRFHCPRAGVRDCSKRSANARYRFDCSAKCARISPVTRWTAPRAEWRLLRELLLQNDANKTPHAGRDVWLSLVRNVSSDNPYSAQLSSSSSASTISTCCDL